MLDVSIMDELNESYNFFNQNCSTKRDMCELMCITLSKFSDIIKKFFSKSDGNCYEKIHSVYNKISEDVNYRLIKICSTDLNLASNLYNEYISGMRSFIESIASSNNYEEEKEKVNNAIVNAITKDEKFINHIFDNNQSCDVCIKDAICNLEVLIDFLPYINTVTNNIKSFYNSYNGANKELWNRLMQLYIVSNIKYAYRTIRIVFNTFSAIYGKLDYNKYKPIELKKGVKFKLL